jgi:metallophosphoesterase (TIGR00282 family)
VRILFIGDIVGRPGRDLVRRGLRGLVEHHRVDFVIANAENAAAGFGITREIGDQLLDYGVDVLTSGNHIWDKREFRGALDETDRIVRPANYPPGAPGRGAGTFTVDGVTIGVVNLMGRVFMPPVDDPFRVGRQLVDELRAITPIIVVDVHAEATSEKMALGRFFDGQVSFVYGTHTHVQTSDEQIFAGGTAYVTDVGMTGPSDGIIGMESGPVLERFTSAVSERFAVQKTGTRQFCAALATIDVASGRALDVKRINLRGLA